MKKFNYKFNKKIINNRIICDYDIESVEIDIDWKKDVFKNYNEIDILKNIRYQESKIDFEVRNIYCIQEKIIELNNKTVKTIEIYNKYKSFWYLLYIIALRNLINYYKKLLKQQIKQQKLQLKKLKIN